MKEYLKTLTQQASSSLAARNVAREYLQALILQSLQPAGVTLDTSLVQGNLLGLLK